MLKVWLVKVVEKHIFSYNFIRFITIKNEEKRKMPVDCQKNVDGGKLTDDCWSERRRRGRL